MIESVINFILFVGMSVLFIWAICKTVIGIYRGDI